MPFPFAAVTVGCTVSFLAQGFEHFPFCPFFPFLLHALRLGAAIMIVMGQSLGMLATCPCIAPVFALALASADCFCGCTYVCTCVCIGCTQVCMCLHIIYIAFALVLRLFLHLHSTCVCIGVAMPLALHLCGTWVAPVLECFVPSVLWKETLRNLHLLWHLLAVVYVGIC